MSYLVSVPLPTTGERLFPELFNKPLIELNLGAFSPLLVITTVLFTALFFSVLVLPHLQS